MFSTKIALLSFLIVSFTARQIYVAAREVCAIPAVEGNFLNPAAITLGCGAARGGRAWVPITLCSPFLIAVFLAELDWGRGTQHTAQPRAGDGA